MTLIQGLPSRAPAVVPFAGAPASSGAFDAVLKDVSAQPARSDTSATAQVPGRDTASVTERDAEPATEAAAELPTTPADGQPTGTAVPVVTPPVGAALTIPTTEVANRASPDGMPETPAPDPTAQSGDTATVPTGSPPDTAQAPDAGVVDAPKAMSGTAAGSDSPPLAVSSPAGSSVGSVPAAAPVHLPHGSPAIPAARDTRTTALPATPATTPAVPGQSAAAAVAPAPPASAPPASSAPTVITGTSASDSTAQGTAAVSSTQGSAAPGPAAAAPVPPTAGETPAIDAARPVMISPPAAATAAAVTSASPTPPASPAPPAHAQPPLTGQLAPPLFTLAGAGQGEHRMTLQVTPDALGPVTVRAVITGDDIRIEMFSPTDSGREALRQILADLRRDLASGGLGASLDLSSNEQFDDRSEEHAREPASRQSPPPPAAERDTRPVASGSLTSTLDITI